MEVSGKKDSVHYLCSVRSIDADILRREVAGPVAGHGFARMEIHYKRNVLRKKFVASSAFVEIERLAAAQYRNAGHLDVHKSGIKFYTRATRSGENAAPVRVAARESGFHQRRSCNGLCDALSRRFGLRAAYFNFDDALRAFAIGNNLQCERAANFLQRRSERAMR